MLGLDQVNLDFEGGRAEIKRSRVLGLDRVNLDFEGVAGSRECVGSSYKLLPQVEQ